MADQIAHQNIENIVIHRNCLLKSRHIKKMKEKGRWMK
jgi:hypothetical protein